MNRSEPPLKRGTEILTHATLGSTGGPVTCEPLDLSGTFAEAKARAVERFEATYLEALLRRCGGNITKASRQAHIARNHLRALLRAPKNTDGQAG